MNEIRQVATAIETEFRKAQPISMPTQDFWDRIAKAAIDKIRIIDMPTFRAPPEENPK